MVSDVSMATRLLCNVPACAAAGGRRLFIYSKVMVYTGLDLNLCEAWRCSDLKHLRFCFVFLYIFRVPVAMDRCSDVMLVDVMVTTERRRHGGCYGYMGSTKFIFVS